MKDAIEVVFKNWIAVLGFMFAARAVFSNFAVPVARRANGEIRYDYMPEMEPVFMLAAGVCFLAHEFTNDRRWSALVLAVLVGLLSLTWV